MGEQDFSDAEIEELSSTATAMRLALEARTTKHWPFTSHILGYGASFAAGAYHAILIDRPYIAGWFGQSGDGGLFSAVAPHEIPNIVRGHPLLRGALACPPSSKSRPGFTS